MKARLMVMGVMMQCLMAPLGDRVRAESFPSRPAVSNGNFGVDTGTWSARAGAERALVIGVTTSMLPSCGAQQTFLSSLKAQAHQLVLAAAWVDTSEANGTRLDNWFSASPCPIQPPLLDGHSLLDACALPTNWFGETPFSGLASSHGGWRGMTNVLSRIVWTHATCTYYVDRYTASLTNCTAFYGANATSIAAMCSDVSPVYDESVIKDELDSSLTAMGHIRMFEQMTNGGYPSLMDIADFVVIEELEKGVPLAPVPSLDFGPQADFYYATGIVAVTGNTNCSDLGRSAESYCGYYWDTSQGVDTYEGGTYIASGRIVDTYSKDQSVCCDYFLDSENYQSCYGDSLYACANPLSPEDAALCCTGLNPLYHAIYVCNYAMQSLSVQAYPHTVAVLRWDVPGGFIYR